MEEILKEVIRINQIKGLDAFMDFAGHVNSVSVRVIKDCGYTADEEREYLYRKTIYIEDGLDEMINELKEIK